MKNKIIAAILLIITLIMCVPAVYADGPQVKAQSALLISADGAQVICEKDPDVKQNPAGLVKIMTAFVAYDQFGMDTDITVPDDIDSYMSPYEPQMGLEPGEIIKSGDLIYAMILASANDAAYALATSGGNDVEKYVSLMNQKANELGMENTKFTNVTGGNEEEQYTTATDLAKLYVAMLKNQKLNEVMSTKYHTIPATNLYGERTYWTNNHLISKYYSLNYYYPNARSGKTSTSTAGGLSAVTSASKGDMEFICVVLNSILDENVNHAMIDSTDLFEYGFNNYSLKRLTTSGDILLEAQVKNARGIDHALLKATRTVKAYLLEGDDISTVEKKAHVQEPINAPLEKDQVVGSIEYIYRGRTIGQVELAASNAIKRNIFKYIGNSILWFFNLKVVRTILALIILAVVSYVGYVVYIIKKSGKRNKRR